MSRDELQAEYRELKAEVAQLKGQEARLQQQVAELADEEVRLHQQAAQLETENAQLRQLVDQLQALKQEVERKLAAAQAEIEALKRELFGPKADRLTPEQEEQLKQLNQDLQEEAHRPPPVSDDVLEEETSKRVKRRPARVRHPLPAHLETETITIEPEAKTCAGCGHPMQPIGEEVSEEIDLIPARLIRRRIVRPKYACRCGEGGVNMAPMPPRLIPQSRLGLGLAVHLLLSRYDDHLSFYHLERQLRERHGVIVPRQQMVQWVEQIALWLRPLYDAMWKDMLRTGYLQVDETPVRVLDREVKGKAARGYLWFYAVPGGDVILEFNRSRGLEVVRHRLETFSGTIQTDAYEVYDALRRRQPAIERIGCLAHARRRFYTALRENVPQAVWFISRIRSLYRIEDEARQCSPVDRRQRRLDQAPAIWEAIKARAQELQPATLPKSSLGKALSYFLTEYDALVGYLRDGRFEIDNNLVENAIRPTAVGRKRWLFIGHPDAGWRSAVIYSIIVSCRRRGINPLEYLTDVLARLPSMTITNIQSLLPGQWHPAPTNTS